MERTIDTEALKWKGIRSWKDDVKEARSKGECEVMGDKPREVESLLRGTQVEMPNKQWILWVGNSKGLLE